MAIDRCSASSSSEEGTRCSFHSNPSASGRIGIPRQQLPPRPCGVIASVLERFIVDFKARLYAYPTSTTRWTKKSKTTYYLFHVAREGGPSWYFHRRYSEFRMLRDEILRSSRRPKDCANCRNLHRILKRKPFPGRFSIKSNEQQRTLQLYNFTVDLLLAMQSTHTVSSLSKICPTMRIALEFFTAICESCSKKLQNGKLLEDDDDDGKDEDDELDWDDNGDEDVKHEMSVKRCIICSTAPKYTPRSFRRRKKKTLERYLRRLRRVGVKKIVSVSFPTVKSFGLFLDEHPDTSPLKIELGLSKSVSSLSLASCVESNASLTSSCSSNESMKKSTSTTSFTSTSSSFASVSSFARYPVAVPKRSVGSLDRSSLQEVIPSEEGERRRSRSFSFHRFSV